MKVLKDVVVDKNGESELFALSTAPGVVGEEMSLELITGANRRSLRVRVVESRPVIVAGAVQHRLQLEMIGGFEPGLSDVGDVMPGNVVEPA